MAERIAAQLTRLLGEDAVTSHHGSLSKERRLDAEQRLKAGQLRALVATASLELGIDIGDVDLAIQVGATRSIATFLQRVGRAGHALADASRRAALFPLTLDELVEGAALLACDPRGRPRPHADAAAARSTSSRSRSSRRASPEAWGEDELFDARPARVAVPGALARGVRRGRRAPHARAAARCSTATA